MSPTSSPNLFDKTNPLSIYGYSANLIGHSLRSLLGDIAVNHERKGKGGLGQMVEELFFQYDVNSNRDADFKEAGLELKCTPLLKSRDGSHRIKERLVCTMIDYFELVNTRFEDSHLLSKCQLMLLLFYLHVSGTEIFDYEFLFRVLWQLPEKDLVLIKQDYETIADKVRNGEAHLLSEGDTLYLGACRKGQKGDSLQKQPFSEFGAPKRAFSLKPAYMRYILKHVVDSGDTAYTNYRIRTHDGLQLVSSQEISNATFENIIKQRFKPFIGKDYIQICGMLGVTPYQSKSKYADICGLIASCGQCKRLSETEEFQKSGITMKTIRLTSKGMPKESMSFKNIDYMEVYGNDNWLESEAYEIFTNRFMFVVFRPDNTKEIHLHNRQTQNEVIETAYILDDVFFWTMPTRDLVIAKEYWENIRTNVLENKISLSSFWSLRDHRKFHVRPKGTKQNHETDTPHGGKAPKLCYWLNAEYIKTIIDNNKIDE